MKDWKLKENATVEERKQVQTLAREQMKLKLLQDIKFDVQVCKIEGWDYKEYLIELENIIKGFL